MLNLLQETLVFIEEQNIWLTFLQSAINEKAEQYKMLHTKLNNFITEEIKQMESFNQVENNEVVVKEEVINPDGMEVEDETSVNEHFQDKLPVIVYNEKWPGEDEESSNVSDEDGEYSVEIPNHSNVITDNEETVERRWMNEQMIYNNQITASNDGVGCSDSELRQSSSKDNSTVSLVEPINKIHKCTCCGKEFKSKQQVIIHMRTHTGEKPFQCNFCNQVFSQSSSCKRHIRLVHQKEPPQKSFNCVKCKLPFTSFLDLQEHTKLRICKKPFQCLNCEKSFLQKSALEQHYRVHTGEKPFECSHCGKHFSQRSSLNRHVRIHFNIKP